MSSKTPETFEGLDTVLTQLCSRARLAYKSEEPFKNQARAKDTARAEILAIFTTALEAAKREERIDELLTIRLTHYWLTHDLNSTPLQKYIDQRIARLSHPNQPKQEGGGE